MLKAQSGEVRGRGVRLAMRAILGSSVRYWTSWLSKSSLAVHPYCEALCCAKSTRLCKDTQYDATIHPTHWASPLPLRLYLISNPLQQRLTLTIVLPLWLRIRQEPKLPIPYPTNSPTSLLLRLLKELLVLLKRPPTRLRAIQIGPQPCEQVRSSENQEDPVF